MINIQNSNLNLFQQICTFTDNYDVYVEYYSDKKIYDIKLKEIPEENKIFKNNIMPGKLYLDNNKIGNSVTFNTNKYILVLN